jgi:hypothetical protein
MALADHRADVRFVAAGFADAVARRDFGLAEAWAAAAAALLEGGLVLGPVRQDAAGRPLCRALTHRAAWCALRARASGLCATHEAVLEWRRASA